MKTYHHENIQSVYSGTAYDNVRNASVGHQFAGPEPESGQQRTMSRHCTAARPASLRWEQNERLTLVTGHVSTRECVRHVSIECMISVTLILWECYCWPQTAMPDKMKQSPRHHHSHPDLCHCVWLWQYSGDQVIVQHGQCWATAHLCAPIWCSNVPMIQCHGLECRVFVVWWHPGDMTMHSGPWMLRVMCQEGRSEVPPWCGHHETAPMVVWWPLSGSVIVTYVCNCLRLRTVNTICRRHEMTGGDGGETHRSVTTLFLFFYRAGIIYVYMYECWRYSLKPLKSSKTIEDQLLKIFKNNCQVRIFIILKENQGF